MTSDREIPAVVLFSLLHFQEAVSTWSILARQVKDKILKIKKNK